MYKDYLFGNPELKNAFLAGCREMMSIMTHAEQGTHAAILSRNDEDWIALLCQREEQRQTEEARMVARAVLDDYDFDKKRLRGMIFDRPSVDDNGMPIDEKGGTIKTYPHKWYRNIDSGVEISTEEFAKLPCEVQKQYDTIPKIKLTSKIGNRVKWVSAYDTVMIESMLEKILPQEPSKLLEMYYYALERHSSKLLDLYQKCFSRIRPADPLSGAVNDILSAISTTYGFNL